MFQCDSSVIINSCRSCQLTVLNCAINWLLLSIEITICLFTGRKSSTTASPAKQEDGKNQSRLRPLLLLRPVPWLHLLLLLRPVLLLRLHRLLLRLLQLQLQLPRRKQHPAERESKIQLHPPPSHLVLPLRVGSIGSTSRPSTCRGSGGRGSASALLMSKLSTLRQRPRAERKCTSQTAPLRTTATTASRAASRAPTRAASRAARQSRVSKMAPACWPNVSGTFKSVKQAWQGSKRRQQV